MEDRFLTQVKKNGGTLTIRVPELLSPLGSLVNLGQPDLPSSRSLTERLIRRLYEELRGDRRQLTARHVEQVIRLATESSSGRRVQLPGGITVERIFSDLVFSNGGSKGSFAPNLETPSRSLAYQYRVSIPKRGAATISVPELGTCFRLKVIDWSSAASDTKRDGRALDADLLRTPLILRNWRPGDAYRPRGRRQARKLKQMLLAGRVPSSDRAGWPVLESDGRVIWARGLPPAQDFCVRDGTRMGVVIEEERL